MPAKLPTLLVLVPLALALLVRPVTIPPALAATRPMSFTSVDAELPDSDRLFPEGPGAEAINNNCLACHSAGMVLNQPALPRKTWQAIVHKMQVVYKAPVAEADAATIVDYLTRIKGHD